MSKGWKNTPRRLHLQNPGQAILLLQGWALEASTHPALASHSSILWVNGVFTCWLEWRTGRKGCEGQFGKPTSQLYRQYSSFANPGGLSRQRRIAGRQEVVPREKAAREEVASRVANNPKGKVESPYAGLAPQSTAYSIFAPDGRPFELTANSSVSLHPSP